jgi:hypothetical protein
MRVVVFGSGRADPVAMTHESVDNLGTRRLRAAADKAYAAAVYGDAVADATFRGAQPGLDSAVRVAAAYVAQTQLVYENARLDHERALDAAAAQPRVYGGAV